MRIILGIFVHVLAYFLGTLILGKFFIWEVSRTNTEYWVAIAVLGGPEGIYFLLFSIFSFIPSFIYNLSKWSKIISTIMSIIFGLLLVIPIIYTYWDFYEIHSMSRWLISMATKVSALIWVIYFPLHYYSD